MANLSQSDSKPPQDLVQPTALPTNQSQDALIEIKLPPELAVVIAQRVAQSGQTQAQVILQTLQTALCQTPQTAQALEQRLSALEGKSIAF